MMLSMLVLLVPILAIVWFFQSTPDEQVEAVDYQPVLEKASQASSYPILAPENYPEQWIPVRVAWAEEGQRWIDGEIALGDYWQLGFLTEDEVYLGLQQRDAGVNAFVRAVSRDGVRSGEVQVGERTWEHWISQDERTHSLIWRDGDMVATVTGDTDVERLAVFAGTLVEQN